MNYLVVMPRFVHKPGDFYYFSLGIAYVSASLKKAGKKVFTLNLNHTAGPVSTAVRDAIDEHGIDVVLTGGLSGNYIPVKHVVMAARDAKGGIVTVVGGGLVSSEPPVAMEGLAADIGVIGEGEITVCELAEALESNSDLEGVAGLIYRKDGQLHSTAARGEIPDLASIPWPDYEGFGFSAYLDTMSRTSGSPRYVQMIASRSCPFDCTFCYHPVGKKYRQRLLDDFFRELDFMLPHYRIEYLNISDELFALNRDRTREFCSRMKERVEEFGIKWDAQLRVDHVDRDLLNLLKSSGCHLISYGIESADDTILKSMRKHITVEQIDNALRLTSEAGIEIQGNFIFGDIEETWETAHNTLEWWQDHLDYQINLTHIKVFPGTHLYKHACEKGIIKDKLKFLEDGCPLVNVSGMSEPEYKSFDAEIQRYLKANSYAPESVEVLGLKGSGCHISIVCKNCKGTIEQIHHPFSPNLSGTRAFCPHCRRRMDLDDAVIDKVLESGFTRLFEERRIVGVWGCGDIAGRVFEKCKSLRRNDIFLLDKNIQKQGTSLWGHTVASPSIIPEEKIDTVIITSIMYADEISDEIASKYPCVERTIKLTDMATIYN